MIGPIIESDDMVSLAGGKFSGIFGSHTPPTVASLVFHIQPTNVVVNTPFGCVAWILDSHGNRILTFTGNVSIFVDAGTGALSGTTTVAAVSGVVTFTGLSLNEAGDYQLVAGPDAFPLISGATDTFTVTA